MNEIRINKFLSQQGIVSRREAEKLIIEGKILVNDQVAKLGQKINSNDVVKINNQIVFHSPIEHKYYLLNKPKKTICSLKDNFQRQTVIDLIDDPDYLYPVGRLDYDTTGVLLITNDGEMANRLMHPSYQITRIYRARLDSSLNFTDLKFLNSHRVLVDGKQSIQKVEQVDKKTYLVTINQGHYHHIKKLFALVNKTVLDLKRVQFGFLTCEKMMVGQYRQLKSNEIKKLKALVKTNF